jgi:hypothetical protein
MLFSRGNWAIFGVRNYSLTTFKQTLTNPIKLMEVSQLVALTKTKFSQRVTQGINPYLYPRMDEQESDQTNTSVISEVNAELLSGTLRSQGRESMFGASEDQFQLSDGAYGLWFVENAYEDLSDIKARQEAVAYARMERPFKFLSKEEKISVEPMIIASGVSSREQFPVLLDFNAEMGYAACSNVEQLIGLRETLKRVGIETFDLLWQFGSPQWSSDFLAKILAGNKFSDAMKERAQELIRFRPDEIEKLDDKSLEKIVSTYFALSQLDTGVWAGLTTPARVRLYPPSEPVSVSSPSTAWSLLNELASKDGVLSSAGVVFQTLDTVVTKKGDEREIRTDVFSVDINDNVNLLDAGCAMLRGFDLVGFRKIMKASAKNKSLKVSDYWLDWMVFMREAVYTLVDNVVETLELQDKKHFGLKPLITE